MTGPSTISVTAREARAVADRLYSRAISALGTDTKRQRGDLKLASRLLRILLRDYSDREHIEVDFGG
jgi:hypothetical protein